MLFKFDLSKDEEDRALELHKKCVIVDGLQASIFTDEYLQKVRDAGVTVVHKTVASEHNLSEAVKSIADWYSKIERNSDKALLATTVEDMIKAKREGKVAYIFGFQNTIPLEYDLNLLEVYYRLGVRIIQLTYNERNLVGDGCGERTNCGLSNFGVELIERMNKLKMIVDISHVGDKSGLEAIELADIPVCTHANARALCNNVRNKDDETIKALAEKDGVIGVNAFPAFVKWTRMDVGERPSVSDLLDHIDYIVNLVGIDHVGLGLDLIDNWPIEKHKTLMKRPDIWGKPAPDGTYKYPIGIENVTQIINITRGLVARGYSNVEIEKILGKNWLRIFSKL
ncbi:MAG: membrane dipeptidase [Candidatus Methanomethylicota archaeon]|uniref:Membrane dipeptidase n=1 Tax=Thermoproteota archaeon TaxID=2056631 RepID=A0A497F4Y0_9CREN|nr:MAG: membrane dipeptidase [Candidatus Verstraetearchaeota archaeon]